jgi:alpha-beta hydrolase superfamily lysophospholipase
LAFAAVVTLESTATLLALNEVHRTMATAQISPLRTGRTSEEVFWTGPEGLPRRTLRWPAPGGARAVVLIVHGHGEHVGRYQRLVDALADLPVDFVGCDHLGHGRSGGRRGDAPDGIDGLAGDLDPMLESALARGGCERAILFAHSMGAVVAVRRLVAGRASAALAGAILSNPAFVVPKTPVVRVKIALGRVAARVAPAALFRTGLDAGAISRDPAVVRAYREDPLVHDRISARLGASLIDVGEECTNRGEEIPVPVLLYHGTADRIASIEGTRRFARGVPAERLEYHELEGFYHEPHNEPAEQAQTVFDLIRDWIVRRGLATLERRGAASA